ncbi:hypothetical protein LEP1GSC061_3301 [Leptospira wolffii serovar Khorat str. Khorat-H2]|nr:hypothetical protein LEP1GSC061_3301 [Leptospira wolffii serovar Khorat str. Khorat-H2]
MGMNLFYKWKEGQFASIFNSYRNEKNPKRKQPENELYQYVY